VDESYAAAIAAAFKRKTRDEWAELLGATDACVAPVLGLDEAPEHPHMRARAVFERVDGVVQPAPAPRFSRTPGAIRRRETAGGGESGRDALRRWGVEL
jgi:alpha-methylacyl-CoA racemase